MCYVDWLAQFSVSFKGSKMLSYPFVGIACTFIIQINSSCNYLYNDSFPHFYSSDDNVIRSRILWYFCFFSCLANLLNTWIFQKEICWGGYFPGGAFHRVLYFAAFPSSCFVSSLHFNLFVFIYSSLSLLNIRTNLNFLETIPFHDLDLVLSIISYDLWSYSCFFMNFWLTYYILISNRWNVLRWVSQHLEISDKWIYPHFSFCKLEYKFP